MTDALEPLSFVQAFYEGGAAAFHLIDVWSDIDLYIVVDDAIVPKTFRVVEKVLASLSPIRLIHEESWPAASGIFQKFYRLEKAGEYLLVDLAVLTVSAPDKFLVREVHGEAVFLFNKATRSKSPHSIGRRSFAASSTIADVSANGWSCSVPSSRRSSCEATGLRPSSSIEPLSSHPLSRHSECGTSRGTTTSACATCIGSCLPMSSVDSKAWPSSQTRRILRRNIAKPVLGSTRRSRTSTRSRSGETSREPRND